MKKFLLAATLAWKNSTSNPKRLVIRCAGITFAVVLMFMQTGFRNALFDCNVRIIELIDCDVVLKSNSREMISSGQTMDRRFLNVAMSHPDVSEAEPFYLEVVNGYLRKQDKAARRIRVIGLDPDSTMFEKLGVNTKADELKMAKTAIADMKSKPMFGLGNSHQSELPFGELFDQSIRLVGKFELGIDFTNHGNLIMSPQNFNDYFSYRGQGGEADQFVDYILLRCSEGANTKRVAKEISSLVGDNITVLTKSQFLASERAFWGKNTPVGLIFLVGTIIGFVVGLIICYQVLASDIADHMGEFATLKAMGYTPSFFASVVVFQAVCLSLFSFIPGLLIAIFAFDFINTWTGLFMFLNVPRAGVVLILTLAMCVSSGFIALRKLLTADPASLF